MLIILISIKLSLKTMEQIPTVCLSCGGSLGCILQFRECMAKKIVKDTGKKYDMNQFDLSETNVQEIIEQFGFDPSIDDCCISMIMTTRLPPDMGLISNLPENTRNIPPPQ